ncbi:MAG: proline racemase family protein [Aeromicrobium sp.]|nr:proline racemase family protein [Burkholderiales bacterium]
MQKIRVIDSHTGGEPTRVVLEGFPNLAQPTLAEKLSALRTEHDNFRAAVCTEPRASDITVGALLLPPIEAGSVASVIFFNNVGYLGICGHGTIGVIATLHYLERIQPRVHRLDTPVGTVVCTLADDGTVTIENVPAYRYRKAVSVTVEGFGEVVGDIAWGGNWFFLVDAKHLPFGRAHIPHLLNFALAIRDALGEQGITGKDGEVIDHIELFGAPSSTNFDSRNFVLCPGSEYDRSPCGTGTSAKVACLADDGKLLEGQRWQQESIVGSYFEASFRRTAEGIIPIISGRAYICGDGTLLLDPSDPFAYGIR